MKSLSERRRGEEQGSRREGEQERRRTGEKERFWILQCRGFGK